MSKVCIGIHLQGEPERLRLTLESLRVNTGASFELMLLGDGVDGATRNFLATLSLPTSETSQALGAAACFNRLAAESDASVVLMLESGAQVGPGWLDHLLAALNADPRNGLAGPSTNNAWNEQGVCPHAGHSREEIARTAADMTLRFGDEVRTLEPLHSLADFCYVVRREVIDAIGGADEEYSLGPCWEMDYNVRAARAGWRGVWGCAAYVHRARFTARRAWEEQRRFEASKRRYQDKFCGARLRGEKTDFREHCRGDACANFAPAALIQLKRPFPAAPPADTASPSTAKPAVIGSEPLVSCIMPTYNRRSLVPQAIRCFLRQDYANVELVIVDDGTDPIEDCVPQSERIRYFRLDHRLPLGAKRNFACEQARGEFIVHWDDDDWYPTSRVRTQVAPLIGTSFDVCGSSVISYYNAATDQAWEYRYPASGARWVGGNTLVYRKSFWSRNRFPDIQVGEDARFVWRASSQKICDLADASLCVAMVHSGNTSPKETKGLYWYAQPNGTVRNLLGDDLYFYRTTPQPATDWPLVSCIMPTYNRRRFVSQSLEYFLHQDYPNRELIIIDDGTDAVEDLTRGLCGVRYLRLPSRTSIGAKRNLACHHAQGQIIAHWDDDDWYSPDRLRYQVMPILAGQADMTGLKNVFVLQLPAGDFWTTKPQLHKKMFVGDVHGGTLVYRKDLLEHGLRYPEISLAEDAYLLHYAVARGKRLVPLSNPGVFVYVRHGTNAWREFAPGKFLDPAGWQRIAPPLNFPASVLASCKGTEVSAS